MSRSRLAVLLPLVIALAVSAPAASASPLARAAATCSDYSNQADAQRAADTRDPDRDGIYCESLPCPCLKPGSGHHRDRKPALFHGKCKRGRLPDKHCTPGRAFHGVTADDVCTPGYSATVRHVTAKTKRRVCKEYGIRRHHRGQYEIDHEGCQNTVRAPNPSCGTLHDLRRARDLGHPAGDARAHDWQGAVTRPDERLEH